MKRSLLILVALWLTACANDPYRNLYEGVRNNNEAKRTPSERAAKPTPSYDAYKKEREKQEQAR